MSQATATPLRLLVVLPSWLGDVVMATPALRLLRDRLRGSFIAGLVRPEMRGVLSGTDLLDEMHADRKGGVMGPKHVAARLRPRRYDSALLLTNSFSSALAARVAGIPRRIGYDRDARGLLLTHPIRALERDGSTALRRRWAPVPAVRYYLDAACELLRCAGIDPPPMPDEPAALPTGIVLERATTPEEEHAADVLLERAGLAPDAPFVVVNPGGNDPAKRWPADRYARLARRLASTHGLAALVNGSPVERDLAAEVCRAAGSGAVALPELGVSIGSLKAIVRRARLMVTNDPGPRHLAAAFGTPLVSLFGPTDHRWTTIPTRPLPSGHHSEVILLADPTLPAGELANDHPDRCRIDRIEYGAVCEAVERLLSLNEPRP